MSQNLHNPAPATTIPDTLAQFLDITLRARGVAISSTDPEGPHQVRVGLRKFRTALGVFGRTDEQAQRLGEEARWIAAEVGQLRDLEVVRGEMIAPMLERHPDDAGLAALAATLDRDIAEARRHVRDVLTGPRALLFFLDAAKLCEPGLAGTALPAEPMADAAFRRRLTKTGRYGRRWKRLDIEDRHVFRKQVKKLRYTIDCGAASGTDKRRRRLLKALRRLQDSLGALNDVAVAEEVLGARAPAAPGGAKAMRRLMKALDAEYRQTGKSVPELWKKFEADARRA